MHFLMYLVRKIEILEKLEKDGDKNINRKLTTLFEKIAEKVVAN